MAENVNPTSWRRPRGYSNAVVASGRTVFVAGQIGWNPETGQFESDAFGDQVRQALRNTVAVLEAAGARPEHITRMTWYVTDKHEYLAAQAQVGDAYRETIGQNYPAMSLVQVTALVEDRARVEIETTAVVPVGT